MKVAYLIITIKIMKNKSKSMRNENNCNKLYVLKLAYFNHKKAFENLSEKQFFFFNFFLFFTALHSMRDFSSLLLLLSQFSRVRLCVTPQTAATRLPCPWDSPDKNTGVGCHCLLCKVSNVTFSNLSLISTFLSSSSTETGSL